MSAAPKRRSSVVTSVVSSLWSGVNQTTRLASRWMHQRGILPSASLGCRVISVGNIQAGGSGKTPLVAKICNEAIQKGLHVCILTRGYRSRWEHAAGGGVILPGDAVLVADCGDEAALLHELCPKAVIGVGHNRRAQFAEVKKRVSYAVDLVLLDDGFQNFQIQKDLEVVALTSALPSEIVFRDTHASLQSADLLVWTKGLIRPETGCRPLVRMAYRLDPPSHAEKNFWLVTGIAHADSARLLAEASGFRVQRHVQFPDHHSYGRDEVLQLLQDCAAQGARVAITGKDWVKWRECGVSKVQVDVLEPTLEILSAVGDTGDGDGATLWRSTLWGSS